MSRVLVVSQPMFLPWVGLFEQARLSDIFVHYDDVQMPQGRSFITRVQIKSGQGISWLTAPVDHARSGRRIDEVVLFDGVDWRGKHLATLRHAYARAPHFKLMFAVAEAIYQSASNRLAEFNIAAFEYLSKWLGLSPQFIRSSSLGVSGSSTARLIDLCERTACDVYVTGHGALRYLDHERFEERRISVRYIDYRKLCYPQGSAEFTPYVSVLDAIAYCGEKTRKLLCSESVYWKDFVIPNDFGADRDPE
jgi:hypothetical protein